MPNTREQERLAVLLEQTIAQVARMGCPRSDARRMAADLIANGVTFAKDTDVLTNVDAVEVVRCKDCESYHFGRCWNGACGGLGANRGVNDFCSYGERRA